MCCNEPQEHVITTELTEAYQKDKGRQGTTYAIHDEFARSIESGGVVMTDEYFKLLIWKSNPPRYSPICIETSTGSVFLQTEEIQKLVRFLIVHKEELGYKGEL